MILRSALVLWILLMLTAAPLAGSQSDAPLPLDLPGMLLTASDLAGVGWVDLERAADQTLTADDLAARGGWPEGAGAAQDAVREALVAAGWQQGYAVRFAPVWDPDRVGLGREVEIELVAYADAAGAAEGFRLVPDVYPTGPIEEIGGTRSIGEESRLVRVAARDPQAGVPSQELALGFRAGRVTAHVLLRDWTGVEPAVATVEAVGDLLLAEIGRLSPGKESEAKSHASRVASFNGAGAVGMDMTHFVGIMVAVGKGFRETMVRQARRGGGRAHSGVEAGRWWTRRHGRGARKRSHRDVNRPVPAAPRA